MEINPIRGLRVKQLCEEQGINQTELSQRIYISQQKISEMINGKANVTETTARAIIKAFPQYRFEWLMGYDDFKTLIELNLANYQRVKHEGELLDIAFFYFAKLNGYTVEHPNFSSAHSVEEAIGFVQHGYKIKKEGQSRQLSLDELRDLENDICDYIGYRLDRYMEKGR